MEVNRILEAADREALALIETHKKQTRKLAEALLVQETLTREEVVTLFQQDTEAQTGSGVAFSV
jgi:ATP-dependent Zn protease